MKCFYHSTDLDGHCAGAVVKFKFPSCEMIGLDYGEEFPWDSIERGETVYMVDFSLQPYEDMEKLNKMCNLIWIDHHSTALKAIADMGLKIAGNQNIGLAGCELAWLHLFNNRPMPKGVRLLGRYDVWDHVDPRVLPYQYGVRGLPISTQDFEGDVMSVVWNKILGDEDKTTNDILAKGAAIMEYINQNNAAVCKVAAYEFEFEGVRFIAANAALTGSKLFDSVYDPDKHDAFMLYYNKNGKHWRVSMYTNKDNIDVGAIAKKHGGGGHVTAAGFRCTEPPFPLFTKEKLGPFIEPKAK